MVGFPLQHLYYLPLPLRVKYKHQHHLPLRVKLLQHLPHLPPYHLPP